MHNTRDRAGGHQVIWFVSSLEQRGGGERFAIEGVEALNASGRSALLVCDRFHDDASFGGKYDLSKVEKLNQDSDKNRSYVRRSWSKLTGSAALIALLRRERPSLFICQSEYDAIRAMIACRIARVPYRVFVFGQMYQMKHDLSRHARRFRAHLETVVASRPGYRETVQLAPPRLAPHAALVNEAVSELKYRAIRRADRVFTLSNQVAWEVELVYQRPAEMLRAAMWKRDIDAAAFEGRPLPQDRPLRLLSVSRLVEKKRIDVVLQAFAQASPQAELRIVGTGPEREKLDQIIAANGLSDRVHFLGSVDDVTLDQELKAADCFISMDIGDFDISVVEAMARGVRVLVAEDFDMKAIGEDLPGTTVVAPTVNALATALHGIAASSGPDAKTRAALDAMTWEYLAEKVAT